MPGDASSSYDAETIPFNGVGLSESRLSEDRRKLLDLVNRLHSTGVQIDMDLPMIAVIGSQSAGKSSLIESISGITLPRAAGTCTRCPTECRLSHSNKPWECLVSLRFITDEKGQPLGQVRNEGFGPPIADKAKVEDRIRRAQHAILNPDKPSLDFLKNKLQQSEHAQLSFSKNCVSLAISGPDVADLSFCDLPGLIASVGQGGNANDIDLVKSLVSSYIEKPSCLILSTVACETDFENQGAHHLAKMFDPEGIRTMPDRIPSGEESRWLQFIRDERETLSNGWYCVKQPDSRSLSEGLTWDEARKKENNFFMMQPWSALDPTFQGRLRTSNLIRCLSSILSDLIASRLPGIHEELYNLLKTTDEDIRKLPKTPSRDSIGEVLHVVNGFLRAVSQRLEGTPDADGLLQTIRPKQEYFKRAIRHTAPNFRPWSKDDDSTLPVPEFLASEEDEGANSQVVQKLKDGKMKTDNIYIDEVLDRAQRARTRELPDNYPFVVQKAYIQQFVNLWESPSLSLFDSIYRILRRDLEDIVTEHFSEIGRGHLQQVVMLTVKEHLDRCASKTRTHIEWLLEVEKTPTTLNVHYYSDYKEKFMSYYRACRSPDNENQVWKNLQSGRFPQRSHHATTHPGVATTLSGLSELGINGIKAVDLLKLLPADEMEPALAIMAGVRAYFQVSYKRFADMIPMAIDFDLVMGLEMGLETVLLDGLGVTGADGYERCHTFLQEHVSVRVQREELQKKRERLNTAKNELRQLST